LYNDLKEKWIYKGKQREKELVKWGEGGHQAFGRRKEINQLWKQ
jgi:hypothetical protein